MRMVPFHEKKIFLAGKKIDRSTLFSLANMCFLFTKSTYLWPWAFRVCAFIKAGGVIPIKVKMILQEPLDTDANRYSSRS
ncbi:hypothetical protein BX666DRAFT_833143 [Dichotomocladium elegans]|nr:hypothetical protein BX666DRAFT_833143 [Dichotomocladium elegans]